MENIINESLKWGCQTKVFYEGKELDLNKLIVVWSDNRGEPHSGSLKDYYSDTRADVVGEIEAGASW